MLLTLYYMAATWFQAWRLSAIRAKVNEIIAHGAGLVLYHEPDVSAAVQQGGSTRKFFAPSFAIHLQNKDFLSYKRVSPDYLIVIRLFFMISVFM